MPTSYIAAAWIAASQPSMPWRIAFVSPRSPETSSQPRSAIFAPFSGVRTRQATASPRARSCRTISPPMKPVPPVTKTFIGRNPSRPRTREG